MMYLITAENIDASVNEAIDLNIGVALQDQDGSGTITHVIISDIPTGQP